MSNSHGHSPEIKSIVLTGGPCSGKTTAMAALRQTFEDRGVNVLFVPEAATHLFSTMGAKVSPEHLSLEDLQSPLISLQINQENLAYDIARKYKNKTLILLDR
jgi:thymidylate kinase